MTENTSTLVQNRSERTNGEPTRSGQYFAPRVDILETESELLLYADMPGVAPDDIDLRYENAELTLRGKVKPAQAVGHLIFGEYDVGDFYRVFQLHESIDASKINAEFKNGVLTVHLPKQEAVKPKQIPIHA